MQESDVAVLVGVVVGGGRGVMSNCIDCGVGDVEEEEGNVIQS